MNNIGEKIRKFRKRSGISQFELELRIDASPGSISRIENGIINPTKETLQKISESLNLTELERTHIFEITNNVQHQSIRNIYELITKSDNNALLNTVVNLFLKELNLYGIIVCLLDGEYIKAKALTKSLYTPILRKIIGKDFDELRFKFNSDAFKHNYMYRVITEKKILVSNELLDFACPPLTITQAKAAAVFIGDKSSICFPILAKDRSIGAVLFTKNVIDDFEIEMDILKEFTNVIGFKISELS